MNHDLSKLSSKSEEDIEKYLLLPFQHLDLIINNLNLLSKNEVEKIHLIDCLQECLFYKKELINLKKLYINSKKNDNKLDFLNQIINCVYNVFNIEKDLIEDYPDFFQNTDSNWSIYTPNNITSLLCVPPNNIKKSINIKKVITWLLFPTFILYPWFNGKINITNDLEFVNITKVNYDRPYNNFLFIYNAVVLNKNLESNFYNLIKSNSFKVEEGFILLDKNLMVDTYLKMYYGIKNLEDEPETINIYINNLNYIQCTDILTKFLSIMPQNAYLNDIPINFNDSFKPESVCSADTLKMNIFSLNIKE